MQTHDIKRNTPNRKSRQIGRGGSRGKTSGRGTKGQKARAGHKIRPQMRDIIKKLPKRRGFGKNRARGTYSMRPKPATVNLSMLEKHFTGDTHITPIVLAEKKLVRRISGKIPAAKILGSGELTKAFTVSGCTFSASAKEKIEKAGGKVL